MFDPNGNVDIDPRRFYGLVKIIQSVSDQEDMLDSIDSVAMRLLERGFKLGDQRLELARANENIFQEIRLSTKRNPFAPIEDQERDIRKFSHSLGHHNFLNVAFDCVDIFYKANKILVGICKDLQPGELLISDSEGDPLGKLRNMTFGKLRNMTFDKLQKMTFESQLNQGVVQRFVSGIVSLSQGKRNIVEIGHTISSIMDNYYRALLTRHTVDGVKVHRDPVITDVAISIFENIDAHGEIESGKKPDEISAYSLHKAEAIVGAISNKNVAQFLSEPEALVNFLMDELRDLWQTVNTLATAFKETITAVENIVGKTSQFQREISDDEFVLAVQLIKDINPHTIAAKEPNKLLTSEERFDLQFRNETLEQIVKLLSSNDRSKVEISNLIQYILERKSKLRTYFQDENSFYVCRIGAGNSFLGEAPGALTVSPGSKPNIHLDEIIGSGFQEVKQFVQEVEASAQWHDLFVATSPSKTADKANVLLIGPMGCGKTEALRAVASDRKSIGIFAQGSDFMTCWKGEAEKNPKRLFEAAVKLQREANRHVHILIDEIDSVLKKQELTQHGEFNLTLEFQILMDGLVHYRGISVWGTTNHPERLPMPMLRRFNKVVIVGELDVESRVKLLSHFVNFMPNQGFDDKKWADLAEKLDGATGDVIRKIVDHVWREKMTWFVQNHNKEALELTDFLNDGEKFEIAHFDDKKRFNFKQRLNKFINITPEDVDKSISSHLSNVAIHNEIQTAKHTYREAREFLAAVNQK